MIAPFPSFFSSLLAGITNRKFVLIKAIAMIAFVAMSGVTYAQGQTYVNGYYRSNGTYVQGHYRTLPNNTRNDNWSTVGNVNPYTGVAGTKPGDSYYNSSSGNYSSSTSSYYNTYSAPSYSTSSYSNTYSSGNSGYRYRRY